MIFVKEIKVSRIPIDDSKVQIHNNYFVDNSQVHCNSYEYNYSSLEMDKVPNLVPHTKHINLKYHQIREHVFSGQIKVSDIFTKGKTANILANPLPGDNFIRHHMFFLGW